jgi:hypothetical protein
VEAVLFDPEIFLDLDDRKLRKPCEGLGQEVVFALAHMLDDDDRETGLWRQRLEEGVQRLEPARRRADADNQMVGRRFLPSSSDFLFFHDSAVERRVTKEHYGENRARDKAGPVFQAAERASRSSKPSIARSAKA